MELELRLCLSTLWLLLFQPSPPIRLDEDNAHRCQREEIKQKWQKESIFPSSRMACSASQLAMGILQETVGFHARSRLLNPKPPSSFGSQCGEEVSATHPRALPGLCCELWLWLLALSHTPFISASFCLMTSSGSEPHTAISLFFFFFFFW